MTEYPRIERDDYVAWWVLSWGLARPLRVETLARNLAIGAALCLAFDIGADECSGWTPGCGEAER